MVGYHFARSTQPQRAIEPLMRAGQAAIGAQALLDATHFLKEAAQLLEQEPRTPERVGQIIRTWATLIEVGYTSDPPTTLTYAEKLRDVRWVTVAAPGSVASLPVSRSR